MPPLHEVLTALVEVVVPAIEIMALLIIAIGTIEAFAKTLGAVFAGGGAGRDLFRPIWLRYSRWLIGGLTFQLAADIIATSAAPTWEDVGKLGAIAVIRTFLNYFLERDQREVLSEGEREASG
ncbi:MAG: DUF1622 domain-containing protein [Reyranellaceae bacterium]